jgi:predicted transcriptional regulator
MALQPNEKITGDLRREVGEHLRLAYEQGASIRELAESMGRSYGFVHRLLGESGAVLRGRGGARRPQ